jgi:hypothetical protein
VSPHPSTAPGRRARRLHNGTFMALSVALLTLALPAVASSGLDLTQAVERIPLPATPGGLTVRVEPIAGRVVLETRDAAAVARKVRAVSRTLCPEVGVEADAVVLRCSSRLLAVALAPHAGGQSLEVRLLQVAPWTGRDGLPSVPLDPARLELGAACPGNSPAGAGECALAAGQLQRAEEQFREAGEGAGASLAALRLGDLSARAGDLDEAVRHWKKVSPVTPFGRLAAARLCETDPRCASSPRAAFLLSPVDAHPAVRGDLVLRQARLEAFAGKALEAAQTLAGEHGRTGACAAEPILCGDILLAALREPGARGAQALTLYLNTPSRDRGPLAVDLARAAAERSAAAGGPAFGANLLSAVSGQVPAARLGDHLARAGELYLEGGDRIRASVVLEFARSRLPRAQMESPRWTRLSRAVAARPGAAAHAQPPEVAGAEKDLEAADRALAASRARGAGGTP